MTSYLLLLRRVDRRVWSTCGLAMMVAAIFRMVQAMLAYDLGQVPYSLLCWCLGLGILGMVMSWMSEVRR